MKFQPFILSMALLVPMTMMGQSNSSQSNQSQANQGNNQTMTEQTSSNWKHQSSSQLSMKDKQFVKKLAKEDMSEINLANLALRKSSNSQVRQYAQSKILAADPAMKQQAQTIARESNVIVPTSASAKEQQEYQKLSKLSGKQFDQEYMKYEARKQGKDLDLVKREINNTQDAQLKNFAQKEKTPVQKAAQSAQQIASSMGVQTSASAQY